jgi:hypothetical protein
MIDRTLLVPRESTCWKRSQAAAAPRRHQSRATSLPSSLASRTCGKLEEAVAVIEWLVENNGRGPQLVLCLMETKEEPRSTVSCLDARTERFDFWG